MKTLELCILFFVVCIRFSIKAFSCCSHVKTALSAGNLVQLRVKSTTWNLKKEMLLC